MLKLDLEALSLGRTYTRRIVTVSLIREPCASSSRRRFNQAGEVYEAFRCLSMLDREAFLALHLNHKNQLDGVHVVSIGSLSAGLVHPREVFKSAILTNAAAIIVMHNHPSGDPTPSREDRDITERLKKAGDILGVPLMDHVVIGADSYRSFGEMGSL